MRNTAAVVCPRRSLPTCFAIDGPDGMKISSLSLLAYRMTGARFAGYAAALGHKGTLNSFKAQRQGEITIVEKRAVILAGGRGTRLKPYTVALPKPLVPVGDKPILEIIVRQLCSYGFTRLTLAVNHQADIIRAYFGDGSKFGIAIDYSLETIPLSTMGPLLLVENLPSSFIVMNGDVLTDLDYGALLDRHEREGNLLSISAAQREQPIDFGVLEVEEGGRLIGFREKPVDRYLVSMGVYALSNRVLHYIPAGEPYGFDNLVLDLLKAKEAVKVYPYAGYWLDIGRPDDYERAVEDFTRKGARFPKDAMDAP